MADQSKLGPDRLLLAYVDCLRRKEISSLDELIGESTLFEMPFLKPNRLVGRREIIAAHAAMFSAIEAFQFELSPPLQNERLAMSEGSLTVTRNAGETSQHEVGLAAESDGRSLTRLSLYADARNVRPWSDTAIL